jgi:hypothetical protein
MKRMRIGQYILLALLVLCLSGCAVIQEQVRQFTDNTAPEIMERINQWIEEQGLDLEEAKARAGILVRAEHWILLRVEYGSYDNNGDNNSFEGYRADCSGFVSMAWQLTTPSGAKTSPTTSQLDSYAVDIDYDELLPGDILNDKGMGQGGHVVIFVTWLNQEQTRFLAFEENGSADRAVQTVLNLEELDNGLYTIVEYSYPPPRPFYAQTFRTSPGW